MLQLRLLLLVLYCSFQLVSATSLADVGLV